MTAGTVKVDVPAARRGGLQRIPESFTIPYSRRTVTMSATYPKLITKEMAIMNIEGHPGPESTWNSFSASYVRPPLFNTYLLHPLSFVLPIPSRLASHWFMFDS